MFKFRISSNVGSDCTAMYDVILDKTYTVKEFVDEILSNHKGSWGTIVATRPYDFICEYSHGDIVGELNKSLFDREIDRVKAVGGYSMMDYRLELKDIQIYY